MALKNQFSSTALVQADLRTETEVSKMFQNTPYNGLIANAGVYESKSHNLTEMSLRQWKNTFEVNVESVFLTIKHFLIDIKSRGVLNPSIVIMGSTAGIFGEAGHSDYAASKAALKGLMLSAKNELVRFAPLGRINMVCPTWTITPMATDFLKQEESVKRSLQTKSIRRLVRAEDVAKATHFLLNPDLSGHITGTELVISGGMEGRVLWELDEIDTTHA